MGIKIFTVDALEVIWRGVDHLINISQTEVSIRKLVKLRKTFADRFQMTDVPML